MKLTKAIPSIRWSGGNYLLKGKLCFFRSMFGSDFLFGPFPELLLPNLDFLRHHSLGDSRRCLSFTRNSYEGYCTVETGHSIFFASEWL